MNQENLSPCPFCGFTSLTINPIARIKAGGEEWRAWVQCGTCNAVGPSVSSDKSEEEAQLLAATLWNRRKDDQFTLETEERVEKWMVWKGGVCPVNPWRLVKIKLRGGAENEGPADRFFWGHLDQGTDIVAYHLVTDDEE